MIIKRHWQFIMIINEIDFTLFFDVCAELGRLVDGGGVRPVVGVSSETESDFDLKRIQFF